MNKILIVEDELIVARDIRRILEKAGYKITGVAQTVEKALSLLQATAPSLVLIDIFLKGHQTGIDLALHLNKTGIPFIYISANSNQPVLDAVKQTNPYGFIVKPFREKDLLVTMDIARYRYESNARMGMPAGGTSGNSHTVIGAAIRMARNKRALVCPELVGTSRRMAQVIDLIEQVAPYDTSVLLMGESGTGKEVAANCIYRLSARSNKPFIKINCAAIPPGLMEAELFGYEKGSFTGSADSRAGKFEQAAGGTLLLDEIGEMPLDMQAKLLRVLQEKEVQPIGSNKAIKIDIRILAATNQNLEKQVGEGKFRLDLYYRLHVFPILLPALRERKEDIPLVLQYFVELYALQMGKKAVNVDALSLQKLVEYNWPGNVRELQNLVERSVLMGTDEVLLTMLLPGNTTVSKAEPNPGQAVKSLEEIERAHILSILQQCHFKITGPGGAAELLDLSSSALLRKIKKLGITKTWLSEDELGDEE